jgi:hypothetical protein
MGTEIGAGAEKIFNITYALTDAEIKWFSHVAHVKRSQLAWLSNYIGWILIAVGVVLSFLSGAIAHRYYGVELNSNASTLVMALFSFFLAGSYANRWLIEAWFKQATASRILRLKETIAVRISEDRIATSSKGLETQTTWDVIRDATISAGAVVLWMDPDTALMIPLRAVLPPEQRSVFVDTIRARIKAAAANKAPPAMQSA